MEQSEAKIGQLRLSEEEMMDIVVDDIDRYEQLSNREELLALAIALAENGAVLEVVEHFQV
jgi:predicted mannosyl-3-phosphoglycerate phosphatase (HAD superfamily)